MHLQSINNQIHLLALNLLFYYKTISKKRVHFTAIENVLVAKISTNEGKASDSASPKWMMELVK